MYSAMRLTSSSASFDQLGAKPFAQAFFGLFVGKVSAIADVVAPTTNLLKDVEVILDVLHRAVIGQMIEQRFHVLLGGLHTGASLR